MPGKAEGTLSKPIMLVFCGHDIGINNLGCYEVS
jgi:hypothetical protein